MSRISSRDEAPLRPARGSERAEELFAEALALPPAQRGTFLAQACGANVDLLAHLVALVAAHEGPETLLHGSHLRQGFGGQAAPPPQIFHGEKPGDVVGRYKLLQQIGEGGCGVVWMAEQEEPVRRRVALKIIKLGMDTKAVVARFEAERQALAMMDHPNIAKVHDAGVVGGMGLPTHESADPRVGRPVPPLAGRPYFVMELVRGIAMTKYCDENQLTPKERLELFIKVCQAIQHAHQKGVIHRDIKPSNILVTVNDGTPTPKVIDFGIAKATQGKLTDATVFTAFEQFIGTPMYMSPEQAEMSSLDIDTRSDIYSLGVLLYELLTGRPPFDPKKFAQAGVDQIRQQIREIDPPRPSVRLSTLAADERTTIARLRNTAASVLSIALRGDLDWIVMRCIEKDRTRRYDTANGLVMDIQRYLRNEPVVARPPSTAYLLQKLIRKHRLGFAATLIVVGVICVGSFVSAWQAVRATQAEREQTRLRAESETARQAERMGRERAEAAEAVARRAEQVAAAGRVNAENLLAFVFTDLGEQLSDFGQLPILRQVSERALAYYETLPAELQSRETRASHAMALAGVGALGWIRSDTSAEAGSDQATPKVRLERAVNMFESLELSGPLTPLMRLGYASVLWAAAHQLSLETKYLDAARFAESGERVLRPALTDDQWGGSAYRQLTKMVAAKAHALDWAGRSTEAVPEFERALRIADQADQQPPLPLRPGLRTAQIQADYVYALRRTGRPAEAREIGERSRKRLGEFIAREPYLVTARWSLALLARTESDIAWSEWDFDRVRAAIEDIVFQFDQLLRVDPKTWSYQGYIAFAWAGNGNWSQSRYQQAMGNLAAAKAAARKGVDYWAVDWAPPESLIFQMNGRFNLARICAATGVDGEADRQLLETERLRQRIAEHHGWSGVAAELLRHRYHDARRSVEFERLNWAGILRSIDELMARVEPMARDEASAGMVRDLRRNAARDALRAAFELGDYATARRELDLWSPDIVPLPPTATLPHRLHHLDAQLTRIHVLARSGELEAARQSLLAWWPEAERLLNAGPDLHFNRVAHARALSIRAEIEGTSREQRVWLERAAGYLRPAAETKKLTRYEGEVLLAGVERQLAALDGGLAR